MSLDSLGRVRTANTVTIFEHFVTSKSAENFDQDIWINKKFGTAVIGFDPINYVYSRALNNDDCMYP